MVIRVCSNSFHPCPVPSRLRLCVRCRPQNRPFSLQNAPIITANVEDLRVDLLRYSICDTMANPPACSRYSRDFSPRERGLSRVEQAVDRNSDAGRRKTPVINFSIRRAPRYFVVPTPPSSSIKIHSPRLPRLIILRATAGRLSHRDKFHRLRGSGRISLNRMMQKHSRLDAIIRDSPNRSRGPTATGEHRISILRIRQVR